MAAAQVRACVASAAGIAGALFNDRMKYCRAMNAQYEAVCRAWPDCPSIKIPGDKFLCGGDVTHEMQHNMWSTWRMNQGFGFNVGSLEVAYRALRPGGRLDWKQGKHRASHCNNGCENTLSLCGKCFDDSVPANIMYGYMTSQIGVPTSMVVGYARQLVEQWEWEGRTRAMWENPTGLSGARRVMTGRPWPAHDQAAVELGIALADNEELTIQKLCGAILAAQDKLQPPAGKNAAECKNAERCS